MLNNLLPYLKLARPDHWFKNIFMLPGLIFAILFRGSSPEGLVWTTLVAIMSTCLIASANYVINEWLDRHYDRFHPKKKDRPSVTGEINGAFVYLEYIILVFLGLTLASQISGNFLNFSAILLGLGLCYNVSPIRTKDRIYLDVLSESLNNPVRFLLGWSIIETYVLPPVSVLIAYWMGGAFLMAVKRFAEYRYIADPEQAGLYRRSFKYYSERSLLVSSFFYAVTSAFFLGVFLVKYRIEYLICFPLLSILFAWYLNIGLSTDSSAQNPERLYIERPFMAFVCFVCVTFLFLSFIDLPILNILLKKITVR